MFFLGLYLRTYQLDRYSLWFDEAASLLSTDYTKTMVGKMGMFDSIEDRYPSFLSSLFIYYWQRLGKDEFTLRMSAVIFAMLTIFAVYRVGAFLFGKKTGLLASFILTISPFHIYYSREVRSYSMVALTVLLSVYFLIKALRYGRLKFWLCYLAFTLISIYLHYMAILILFAELLYFLFYYKRYARFFKKWLFVNILFILFLIPWLINVIFLLKLALFGDAKYFWVPWWAGEGSFKNVFYTLKNFSFGYNVTGVIYNFATVIFLLLLGWGLIKKQKQERRDSYTILLLCFLIPIISMFLISKIKVWYVDRYILPCALFYYLLVANGLSRLRNKYAIPILCSMLILNGIGIKNYYLDILPNPKSCIGVQPKRDYRSASRYIVDNFQQGDVVFHVDYCATLPFEYYFKTMRKDKSKELNAGNYLLSVEEGAQVLPFKFREQGVKKIPSNISVGNQRRVWLVYSGYIFDSGINLGAMRNIPEEVLIRKYIESLYSRKSAKEFKGIIVYLYEKNDNQKKILQYGDTLN